MVVLAGRACYYCHWLVIALMVNAGISLVKCGADGPPRRLLVDTDVDSDDVFALLYLLKLNRSEFDLQGITINANAWVNAGHGVNQIYDILHMMGRDDVAVGVGGEGGILEDGTVMQDVGGYVPLIDQGMSTTGGCRYKQSIPLGAGGKLGIDTMYGSRKAFLPQGSRRYSPLDQPTAQQVLADKISEGPATIILFGAHTNLAIFLMTYPHLKKNIEHIYAMGGSVRLKNPKDCCPENDASCVPKLQCGDVGNLFNTYRSNPYAEYNFYTDPFAAYQVLHSGVPMTLVPLDATDTIPVTEKFFQVFEENQGTYEAQYIFQSLKLIRDGFSTYNFYTTYCLWDSFTAGVAISIMRHARHNPNGENEFAEMEFMNLTVVTSNEPYGVSDGSNPFFDDRTVPKFNLEKNGVHSGHVQTGMHDPFCTVKGGKGKCQDGYTKETTDSEAVRVLVATKSKANKDTNIPLTREFYRNFLEVLNHPLHSGRFNFTTQSPYYSASLYKPDYRTKGLGKPVVFDMDMSAGDFVALLCLLKAPVEEINLKAIFVSPTGWANAATLDVIYDLLHMMGRDDIPVGLGDHFAVNQTNSRKHHSAIPQGAGGFLDSDTLYGLARDLPRSPRRYTAENSVKFGAPRDTDHPELRQPLVLEVWDSVLKSLDPGSKITMITNGPLTSLATIITTKQNTTDLIQEIYIVGGHLRQHDSDKGNVFSIPANQYSELNVFLDPLAAKTVLDSGLNITLIPLYAQRRVSSFPEILHSLRQANKTPEARFAQRLISRLYRLQRKHHRYHHMETFLGEILGAIIIAGDESRVNATMQPRRIKIFTRGDDSVYGQMDVDINQGKAVNIMHGLNATAYYDLLTDRLSNKEQSAAVGSFNKQMRNWSKPLGGKNIYEQ